MKHISGMRATLFVLSLMLLQGAAIAGKSMELRSANTYYNQGEIAQALTWYQKADEKGTNEAQVYQRLVELYADKKDWVRMREAFAKIDGCKDKPKKLAEFKKEAQRIVDSQWMGLWNGSIRHYDMADSLLALGDSAGATDNFAKSRERLQVALDIQPGRQDLLKRIGDISISEFNAMYSGKEGFPILSLATAPYEELATAHPDSLAYTQTLIQLYFNLRDFDKARIAADRGLEHHPEDIDLLSFAGKARIQQALAMGDGGKVLLAEASDFIRRAVDKNPEDPKLLYNLAMLYRDMGQVDQAITTFDQVIAVAGPNDPYAFDSAYSLAVLYIQDLPEEMQDPAKAATYFEKCLEMQPDNSAIKTNLGVSLMRTGIPENINRGKKLLGY